MALYYRPSIVALGVVLLGLLAACTSQTNAPAPGAVPNTAAGAPTRADVLQVLTGIYTDQMYATRKYTLTLDTMTVGAARQGDAFSDGVPANSNTTVYPVKATLTRITAYSTDNSTKHETITGEYSFFRDELGAWTCKIQQQTIQ